MGPPQRRLPYYEERGRETLNNEFDSRIKQSVYVQALDTYKKAEERLAEERQTQKGNVSYMRNSLLGSSADALQIATSNFFLTIWSIR